MTEFGGAFASSKGAGGSWRNQISPASDFRAFGVFRGKPSESLGLSRIYSNDPPTDANETGDRRGLTEEWSSFTWNDFSFFTIRFAIIRVISGPWIEWLRLRPRERSHC